MNGLIIEEAVLIGTYQKAQQVIDRPSDYASPCREVTLAAA